MENRRRSVRLAARCAATWCIACAAVLLIVGCPLDPIPDDGEPGGGGVVFRVFNGEVATTLDPAANSGAPEFRIISELFEPLLQSDPETAEPIPALASAWHVSADGLTYTFTLREAYFSDGTRITANHFVESWLRLVDPAVESPYAWFVAMFVDGASEYMEGTGSEAGVGLAAPDESTLELRTVGPVPYVLSALTHPAFSVVPTHVVRSDPGFWDDPSAFVGSGPFALAEVNPGESIAVEKNPSYWDAETVSLERVEFIAGEPSLSDYDAGMYDWMTGVSPDDLAALVGRMDYHTAAYLGTYYYVLNLDVTPLDDDRVRRALSMAIDRTSLVESVLGTGGQGSAVMVPPMSDYPGAVGNDVDVDTAKALLADAGYPGGAGFPEMEILYNSSGLHRAIAEHVAGQWETNLGIPPARLRELDWSAYLDERRAGAFEVVRAGWIGDYPDPNTFLDMFVTSSSINNGGFSDPQYDTLIERAATETGTTRLQTLAEAEEILVATEQAVIPLYHYTSSNVIDTSVWGGWYANVMDTHPLKHVYRR